MILVQVHQVLKVELDLKKGFWLFMVAFRPGDLCMKERDELLSCLYVTVGGRA